MSFMKAFNHGKGKIDLTHIKTRNVSELCPIEFHMKEDGSENGEPSFAIVLTTEPSSFTHAGHYVIGQMSFNTLSVVLDELGFKLEKKDWEHAGIHFCDASYEARTWHSNLSIDAIRNIKAKVNPTGEKSVEQIYRELHKKGL